MFFFNKTKTLIVDGTFKSAPFGFYQILIFQSIFLGRTFPLIYFLLKNKTEKTYVRCLTLIKEKTKLNPSLFVCDFEKGLSNAIETVFSNAKIQFCFFHFSQSIWRRIQQEGLTKEYKSNSDFKKLMKYTIATAFLDPCNTLSCFAKIKQKLLCLDDRVAGLVNYLEYTYFGVMKSSQYKCPIFSIDKWNVRDQIINSEPRTSNGAEAFHRTLNQSINTSNPNIALLFQKLLEGESLNEIELEQAKIGNIEWPRQNNEKEFKLLFLVKNEHFLKEDEFLSSILKIYDLYFK